MISHYTLWQRERLICRGLPPEHFPVESCRCSLITGPLPCPDSAETLQLRLTLRNCTRTSLQCAGALPGVLFLRLYRERSAEFCSRVRGHQREEFLKVFLKKPRKKEEGCGCSGALYTSLPHPSVRRRRGRAAPDTALGSGTIQPFQAEKARTPRGGCTFCRRWRTGCSESLRGWHGKRPVCGHGQTASCGPEGWGASQSCEAAQGASLHTLAGSRSCRSSVWCSLPGRGSAGMALPGAGPGRGHQRACADRERPGPEIII